MHGVYFPESVARRSPSAASLNFSRALVLARAWQLVEPLDDFPAFVAGNTEDVIMGIGTGE